MRTLVDKWEMVKKTTSDDSALSTMIAGNVANSDRVRLNTDKYYKDDRSKANYVVLQAEGDGVADKVFTATIYGGNEGGGFLEKVSVVSFKLLSTAANVYDATTFKVAAVTAATSSHPMEVYKSYAADAGRVYFDATGFQFLVIKITDLGGASGATSANMFLRAY